MKVNSLVIGFISGFAVAGVGVLFSTPASGKEVRTNLKETKEETILLLKDVQKAVIQLKNDCISAANISKEQVNLFIKDVKELIQEWNEDTKEHTEAIQVHIKDVETAISELEAAISPTPAK